MNKYIPREEICNQLRISDEQLQQYEAQLELGHRTENFHISIARTIGHMHELVLQGISLQDVKYLSFCSEQFSEIVPSLKAFAEFSPRAQLSKMNDHYHEMVQEFNLRENQYKERIVQLEEQIGQMGESLEEFQLLKAHLEKLSFEQERAKLLLQEKDTEISKLKENTEEYVYQLNEINYQNAKRASEIEKLEARLQLSDAPVTGAGSVRSAVDIEALLRKKEREIKMKHQREIFDLKKQVEGLVAQKERDWNATR